MSGELRVTVVATGIGGEVMQEVPKPVSLVKKINGEIDYDALEKPAVSRKPPVVAHNQVVNDPYAPAAQETQDMGYYDIPAFLRRQAD